MDRSCYNYLIMKNTSYLPEIPQLIKNLSEAYKANGTFFAYIRLDNDGEIIDVTSTEKEFTIAQENLMDEALCSGKTLFYGEGYKIIIESI